MIRVLIVDDSATTREYISTILGSDPEIEVVGKAADGLEGVALAIRVKPDVIVMDITMPRMNGYEATRRIMEVAPTPIIVVTSSTEPQAVRESLDTLLAGALEIVQRPGSLAPQGHKTTGEELISKVKAVSRIRFPRHAATTDA